MPKQFYTEKDIEDLFLRGTKSLQVTQDVVLTGLAYEKARSLGLQLVTDQADNPPAAPVRPYLSNGQAVHAQQKATLGSAATLQPEHASTTLEERPRRSGHPDALLAEREAAIEQRIRSAVIAKLGNQVDAKLLDNIIHRVVKGIGFK